jgi:hypothetical protein
MYTKSDVVSDGLPAHEILKRLRRISLSPKNRKYVLDCDAFYRSHGCLTDTDERKIRAMYDRNIEKIVMLKNSEERARVSMARERMSREGRAAVDKAIALNEKKPVNPDDLGI